MTVKRDIDKEDVRVNDNDNVYLTMTIDHVPHQPVSDLFELGHPDWLGRHCSR